MKKRHVFLSFLDQFFVLVERKNKKFQKGVTLIELLVSVGILTFLAVILLDTSQLRRIQDTQDKFKKSLDLSHIKNQTRTKIHSFQIFSKSSDANSYLGGAKPAKKRVWERSAWAVKRDGLVAVSECPTCKRRFGLIIFPVDDTNGLYKVVFRGILKKEVNPSNFNYTQFHREVYFITAH